MKEYLNVNWEDGMKINKTHLIHNDRVRDYLFRKTTKALLKSFEFGLFPNNLYKDISNIYIEDSFIVLKHCRAITRSGTLIDIGQNHQLKFNLKNISGTELEGVDTLLVVISVDPLESKPFGDPLPEELPPRQPYAQPKIKMTLVQESSVQTVQFSNQFTIVGAVTNTNGNYLVDENYIPPSSQVIAHPTLINRYLELQKSISEIGMNATQVVQRARAKKRRGEINDLAENTFYLMEKIVFFLAQYMNHIRTIYKEESPIYFISFLNSFGRIILTALNCLKSEDREALLRYYESHLGLKAHQFEDEMKGLSQIEYNHLRLNEVFAQADEYLGTIRTFVSKATHLEFHSVERVDVVRENTVKKSKLDIF